MKKKSLLLVVLAVSLVATLSGCSKTKDIKPAPSTTKSASPTKILTPGIDPVTLPSGLIIPQMGTGSVSVINSGVDVDIFGKKYVNDAYQFAFAFVYKANQLPGLWQPNSKKDPLYKSVLESEYLSLSKYFDTELQSRYVKDIPKLIDSTIKTKNQIKLNETASYWSPLIMVPMRLPDGSLRTPVASNYSDTYLTYPWNLGVSLGAPVTKTLVSASGEKSLVVRFQYSIIYPFGDYKSIKETVTITRDIALEVIPNPSKDPNNPWLVRNWASMETPNIKVEDYNPDTMGVRTFPSVRFP